MYSVAKKKGHTEVCKEIQVFESGRVPQVRTNQYTAMDNCKFRECACDARVAK